MKLILSISSNWVMTVINASAAEFFSGLCSSSVVAALALIKDCTYNSYKSVSFIHRGYYITACGYEFYLWVFNSISSWKREDNIHIHKRACNIYSVYYINIPMMTFLTIFSWFPNTFRGFPKILEKLAEGQTIVSEYLRRIPKIAEDKRRFPRKNISKYSLRDYATLAMMIF